MSPRVELHPIREGDRAQAVEFPFGDLVAFTCPAPGKSESEDVAAVLTHDGAGLLLVVDGMGGQNGGREASRCTLETIAEKVRAAGEEGTALRHAVLDGIEAANRAVLDLAVGAGATLAALELNEHSARVLHVGDSFVLQVGQRGKVKAQTISHSPTGYAVEAGLLDAEEAMLHEERHLVLNYLGQAGMRIEVGASQPIASRDTLLVASDGLTDNVTPEEIVAIVRKGPLLAAGERLALLARRRMTEPQAGVPSKPDDLTFLLFRPRGAGVGAGGRANGERLAPEGGGAEIRDGRPSVSPPPASR